MIVKGKLNVYDEYLTRCDIWDFALTAYFNKDCSILSRNPTIEIGSVLAFAAAAGG